MTLAFMPAPLVRRGGCWNHHDLVGTKRRTTGNICVPFESGGVRFDRRQHAAAISGVLSTHQMVNLALQEWHSDDRDLQHGPRACLRELH
jgi:hypothetical protein